MRPWAPLVAIITCLALAGCGSASQSSSTQAAASAETTSISSTGDGVTITTSTTSASAPPEVPKAKAQRHHGGTHAVSQGAHVETHLTIMAHGDLSPPVVSIPSGVGVVLHIANHGSGIATVALSVPSHPSVHVAPRTTAALQTGGLKDGTYRILVNGTPRGQLMIGAQGGP